MNKSAAARHMGRVADNGCVVCKNIGNGWVPAEVHHIRSGASVGLSQRASDWFTISLCPTHHRGKGGYHEDPGVFQMRYGTEYELLAQTLEEIYG